MHSEKIVKFRECIQEQYRNMAGIVVLKNDEIVLENYFNGYNQNDTIPVASVTKSILSALIGIAFDKGAIKSIEQNIPDYFPDYKIKRGKKKIVSLIDGNVYALSFGRGCFVQKIFTNRFPRPALGTIGFHPHLDCVG